MAFLHRVGYKVISLAEAYAGLFEGKTLPPRAVVLTFDDGCVNFSEYAWPVLKKFGFPVSMFLVAGMLGKTNSWMEGAAGRVPLLDADRIRDLRLEGVSFGSHTLNHVNLTRCAPETARREIWESRARLEDLLGEPVLDFCYPFGAHNQNIAAMVADAGYRLGLTCLRASANHARSAFELPRKAISYGDTLPGFLWKIYMKNTPKKSR
jgi:peptidoglycan/xylan/chitin deacetylase (PgdA/CDA1 family)